MTDTQTITILDLDDERHGAEVAAKRALHDVRCMGHDVVTFLLDLENNSASDAIKNRAVDLAASVSMTTLELTETFKQMSAIIAALSAGMKTLLQQRDDALDQRDIAYNDMIDWISESQGCTREDADHLITFLVNSDQTLLADDMVLDHMHLSEIRDLADRLVRETRLLLE